MRIASIETRVYRYPLDPPFRAAWDPVPRTHQDATIVVVRTDDGVEGYASGDGCPDRELLERLLIGRRRDGRGDRARDPGDGRLPPRAQLDSRGRGLGPRRPLARRAALAPARRPRERVIAYASTGELVSAGRARPAVRRAARRGRPRGQASPPLGRLATRPSRHRGRARRESAATSRSWWTRTRAGACPET